MLLGCCTLATETASLDAAGGKPLPGTAALAAAQLLADREQKEGSFLFFFSFMPHTLYIFQYLCIL